MNRRLVPGSRGYPPRLLLLGGGVALIVAILLAYWGYGWWHSPERKIGQFIRAARDDDTGAMLSLVDPSEVERLGLSPTSLRAMLRGLAGSSGPVVLADATEFPYGRSQSLFNRGVDVRLYDERRRPLPRASDGVQKVHIIAYNTDAGWKIGLSKFLVSVALYRFGKKSAREPYLALCRQHGVQPLELEPVDLSWFDIQTRREDP